MGHRMNVSERVKFSVRPSDPVYNGFFEENMRKFGPVRKPGPTIYGGQIGYCEGPSQYH